MTSERRHGLRVPVQIWVEEAATDHELYYQRSANLSAGGMYLENTIPRAIGTQVTLRFNLPGDQDRFEVRAEVVSAIAGEEEFGMALKFVNLEPQRAERIRQFVADRHA